MLEIYQSVQEPSVSASYNNHSVLLKTKSKAEVSTVKYLKNAAHIFKHTMLKDA